MNKRIELGHGFVADITPHDILLKNDIKTVVDDDGKASEQSNTIGSYGNLQSIMKRVFRETLKNDLPPVSTITEFMEFYKKTDKKVDEQFKHFKL